MFKCIMLMSPVNMVGKGKGEREVSFVDIVQTVNIYSFCKYVVYIIQLSNLLLRTEDTAQCLAPLLVQKYVITSHTNDLAKRFTPSDFSILLVKT